MNRRLIRAVAGCTAGVFALLVAKSALAAPPPSPTANDQSALDKETVSEADFQRQLDQFEFASRVSVNKEIPPDQRLLVDYGGYLSINYLSVDDPAHNTHILRDGELVGYADVNLDNAQEFFFRGHMSYKDYGDGDGFGGGIEESGQHTAVDQMFYRFDLQKYLGAYEKTTIRDDVAVILGRQTVVFGNGLVFNQNIDGGVLDIIKGPFSFQGVAGQSVPDTIDFDTSRPGFNDRTRRGFFGALISAQVQQHRPYVYFLSERDLNSDHPLVNASGTTRFDYNAEYIGAGSTGALTDRLAYGVEGTLETGNGLSNDFNNNTLAATPQRRDEILSFAGDGRIDYLFSDPHNTRASGEVIMASGDHDRFDSTNETFGGNEAGTKDLAFNGFGLMNTGLSFAPQVSNVLIERAGFATQPFNQFAWGRKLEVGADAFIFEKYLEKAPIDEPSDSGRYLGWEPDFFLNYQITSDLTFAMRYGLFFPSEHTIGRAERDAGNGTNSSRQLFFTGVTLAF